VLLADVVVGADDAALEDREITLNRVRVRLAADVREPARQRTAAMVARFDVLRNSATVPTGTACAEWRINVE